MNFKTCCMGFCHNTVKSKMINSIKCKLLCEECIEKFKNVYKSNQNITGWARGAVRRAQDRAKVEVQITYEDIVFIWPEDNRCPILGTEFKVANGTKDRNRKQSPSLDRIDPKKGYVLGNIQIISDLANKMKQNATAEEIKRFCKYYENSSRNT